MSYRELAEQLGSSAPAVHKRMQALVSSGTIFTGASISTRYLNTIVVTVFGRIETERKMEEVISDLRKNDTVCFCMACSSNMMYVSGLLRRPTDMDAFRRFVCETCQMKDSTMAIEFQGEPGEAAATSTGSFDLKLSPLDLRIIRSLHHDARKSYGKVAAEVGASARTVRKHLERMVKEGSVELWACMNHTPNQDFTEVLHVFTKEGVDRFALGVDIMRRFPHQAFLCRNFCNIPDLIFVSSAHSTMSEMNDMLKEMSTDDRIRCMVPNIMTNIWLPTRPLWRDEMLPKLGGRMANEASSMPQP